MNIAFADPVLRLQRRAVPQFVRGAAQVARTGRHRRHDPGDDPGYLTHLHCYATFRFSVITNTVTHDYDQCYRILVINAIRRLIFIIAHKLSICPLYSVKKGMYGFLVQPLNDMHSFDCAYRFQV